MQIRFSRFDVFKLQRFQNTSKGFLDHKQLTLWPVVTKILGAAFLPNSICHNLQTQTISTEKLHITP